MRRGGFSTKKRTKMNKQKWMIYGANGTTGKLIAEEAIHRGHRPILAGRSAEKLTPLAEHFGLAWLEVDLLDDKQLGKTVGDFELVFNAAGPFVHTAAPLVRACLKAGTSYLDVAGEVMVLEQLLALDQQAQEVGIAIIPGVGFNVLASDSLTLYTGGQIENPTSLDIATSWITNQISPGSAKTMIESVPIGTLARFEGQLKRMDIRNGLRQLPFLDDMHTVLPATLGDLATAYRTTGIPNIRTYTAFPERTASIFSQTEPLFRTLYQFSLLRRMASKGAEFTARRGRSHERTAGRSQVWVRVRNEDGDEKQAWLETMESYQFTAAAGVRSVEKVLSVRLQGVLTPALAFGADFVLEIPGTRRADRLTDARKRVP
jgi:short subunit dehydrogenase-like uncharacterized protein